MKLNVILFQILYFYISVYYSSHLYWLTICCKLCCIMILIVLSFIQETSAPLSINAVNLWFLIVTNNLLLLNVSKFVLFTLFLQLRVAFDRQFLYLDLQTRAKWFNLLHLWHSWFFAGHWYRSWRVTQFQYFLNLCSLFVQNALFSHVVSDLN